MLRMRRRSEIDGCGAFRSGEGVEMFCPKCGKKNADDAKFCPFCGAKLPSAPMADAAKEFGQMESLPEDAGAGAGAGAMGGEQAADAVAAADAASTGTPGTAASSAPATGTRVVTPGSMPAARKKSHVLPLAIAGVIVVAIIAAAVFVLPGVFGSIFGGGGDDTEERANASVLTYGLASPSDGYDYFYSYPRQAIVRVKAGSTDVEDVLVVPDNTELSYDAPAFYVTHVAADDGIVFYTTQRINYDQGTSTVELRCVTAEGEGDHKLLDLGNGNDDDSYTSVNGLYAFGGRVYVVLQEGSYAADLTTMRVVSIDAMGEEDPRTECTLDDYYGNIIVAPEKLYYVKTTYNSGGKNYSSVYASNLDGSEAERIYSTEGATVSEFALSGGKLVCWCYDSLASTQSIVLVDPETGTDETIYTSAYGEWIGLLAVSDSAVYLESAQLNENSYDITTWDLKFVPLGGGEAETLATGLDYYNATAYVSNGRLMLLENGQDISSSGMQAEAIDLKTGEVIEEYDL